MLDMEAYMHIALNMNVVKRFTTINSFFLHFGICSLLFGSIMSFCGEMHIIFCRNTPTLEQFTCSIGKTLKYLLPVLPPVVFGIDTVSNIQWLEPTYMGNQWQIYCGRGFGYESSAANVKVMALDYSYNFKQQELVNNSYIITNAAVDEYIQEHKEELMDGLPLPSLIALGLKPSVLPSIFGK